jgi:hypothetical protein
MKGFVRSATYARIRFGLGFLYAALGAMIIVQMLHGVGLRPEALPGLALGGAMILLALLRLRAGWPAIPRR